MFSPRGLGLLGSAWYQRHLALKIYKYLDDLHILFSPYQLEQHGSAWCQ
jgi:hypothetical protein